MEIIFKRRSIRDFTSKPVSEAQFLDCIKAGMNAPSAGNEQPWQFVVINERSILDRIPDFHPFAGMLREAPAAILVCGDMERLKYQEYWIQDCAAATQNILLAIAAMDLGGVWLGIYPNKERISGLKNLLELPDHIIPFSLIAMGYPKQEKSPKNIFEKDRVHMNGW